MCGKSGCLLRESVSAEEEKAIYLDFITANTISNARRGGDRTKINVFPKPVRIFQEFDRLAQQGISIKGDQPFMYECVVNEQKHLVTTDCIGEIYNFQEIIDEHKLIPESPSDCEVVKLLYQKYGASFIPEMCRMFNGEFAFSIYDINLVTGDYKLYMGSDRRGLRPVFFAHHSTGFYHSTMLESLCCMNTDSSILDCFKTPEMKAFVVGTRPSATLGEAKVERIKPRHWGVIEKKDGVLGEYQQFCYFETKPEKYLYFEKDLPFLLSEIRRIFKDAVRIRMQSERPDAYLISGGFDSSSIAGQAAEILRETGSKKVQQSFSCGIERKCPKTGQLLQGTDEKWAKKVAKSIGSNHTHVNFTEERVILARPRVIKAIGTIDITTIRAATLQFLLIEWISIHRPEIKVLHNGDLHDEYGYYKYFEYAPSPKAFAEEGIRLIDNVETSDGIRADRSISYFGIEARFVFGDIRWDDLMHKIDPSLRMCHPDRHQGIEKWLARAALAGLIPDDCLWRPKEAFSDGCLDTGRSLYQIFKEHDDKLFTDQQLEEAQKFFTHLPPVSKESLFYRLIFCLHYGVNESVAKTIPFFWLPKWCGDIKEPSARVLPTYIF